MESIQTLIIGAGPAGLAVAGRMRQSNLTFVIIEKSDKIANSWNNHYDRLLLHSTKQFSYLPLKKFPKDYPTYVSKSDYYQYCQNYAQQFKIKPHFNTVATKVERKGDKWTVTTTDTNNNVQQLIVNNVIIATGMNRVPFAPTWPGMNTFKGDILHSANYKNSDTFLNKRVLVIGMGNTGAELALDLAESGVHVYISVRSPIMVIPRDILFLSVQFSGKLLELLPFGIGDWLGSIVRKLVIGDLSKYGIQAPNVYPAVLQRETGKSPLIDLGTIRMIRNGRIKILPDITGFCSSGVEFGTSGEQCDFDAVILATGYRSKLDEFIVSHNIDNILDKNQVPKLVGEGEHEGLYFVGFNNYTTDGVLGAIINDSKIVVNKIMRQRD